MSQQGPKRKRGAGDESDRYLTPESAKTDPKRRKYAVPEMKGKPQSQRSQPALTVTPPTPEQTSTKTMTSTAPKKATNASRPRSILKKPGHSGRSAKQQEEEDTETEVGPPPAPRKKSHSSQIGPSPTPRLPPPTPRLPPPTPGLLSAQHVSVNPILTASSFRSSLLTRLQVDTLRDIMNFRFIQEMGGDTLVQLNMYLSDATAATTRASLLISLQRFAAVLETIAADAIRNYGMQTSQAITSRAQGHAVTVRVLMHNVAR